MVKRCDVDSAVVFLITKGHCYASPSPFFWRELQKVVSGKEKYYTGDKKYCKALSRQRKHLLISEESHGYNLGHSLAFDCSICISLLSTQCTKWWSYLQGCKSRVSLLKTTVPKLIKAIQIDGAVNEIKL